MKSLLVGQRNSLTQPHDVQFLIPKKLLSTREREENYLSHLIFFLSSFIYFLTQWSRWAWEWRKELGIFQPYWLIFKKKKKIESMKRNSELCIIFDFSTWILTPHLLSSILLCIQFRSIESQRKKKILTTTKV